MRPCGVVTHANRGTGLSASPEAFCALPPLLMAPANPHQDTAVMVSVRILVLSIAWAASRVSFAQTPAPADELVAQAIAAQLDASMHDGATIHGARMALQERVHEF